MAWTEITRAYYEPQTPTLRKRLHGRGVGVDRTVHACAEQGRSTAQMADARDMERHPVYRGGGLLMSDAAERLPALYDGSALFLPAARQRHIRHHQRNAGDVRTPSVRTDGRADSRRDRQPKRENHGKRRTTRRSLSSGRPPAGPGGCRQEDQGPQAPYPHRYARQRSRAPPTFRIAMARRVRNRLRQF